MYDIQCVHLFDASKNKMPKRCIRMLKDLFADAFDLNKDGTMDNFEKRAEHSAFMNEIRIQEGIDTELSDMSLDQLNELANKTGIDPSGFGF